MLTGTCSFQLSPRATRSLSPWVRYPRFPCSLLVRKSFFFLLFPSIKSEALHTEWFTSSSFQAFQRSYQRRQMDTEPVRLQQFLHYRKGTQPLTTALAMEGTCTESRAYARGHGRDVHRVRGWSRGGITTSWMPWPCQHLPVQLHSCGTWLLKKPPKTKQPQTCDIP